MNATHRSCSSRRRNAVGTLAGFCAVLAPLAVFAADVPTPVTAAPAATPAPADASAAPAVAPAPAPSPAANSPLNSVLDNSPYLPEGYHDPVPAQQVARAGVSPVPNLQYKGFSQEGDTVYYLIADTRTSQSHWVTLGQTWNIPNGGSVTLSSVPTAQDSINVDTPSRAGVNIPMYKDTGKPIPAAGTAAAPAVVLSTDTLNQRGGRRGGGGGGFGGPGGGGPGGGGFGGRGGAGGGGAGGGGGGGGRGGAGGGGGGGRGGAGGGGAGGGGFGGGGAGGGAGGGGGFGGGGAGGGGGGFGAAGGGGAGGGGGGFGTGTTGGGFGTTTAGAGAGGGTRRNIVAPAGGG